MQAIATNYGSTLAAAPEGPPYKGPSLFLKGENSAYIQTKHQPIIGQLFPSSELRIIAGVGHWLHAEKPDEFNANVVEFINSP
jgi:esterase